jgi:hypothetical protein
MGPGWVVVYFSFILVLVVVGDELRRVEGRFKACENGLGMYWECGGRGYMIRSVSVGGRANVHSVRQRHSA